VLALTVAACDSGMAPAPEIAPELAANDAFSKQPPPIDLCHYDAVTATYFSITVRTPQAEAAHRIHGDGKVGDAVPGMGGFVFDENCQPVSVGASCPCYNAADLEAIEWQFWFRWTGLSGGLGGETLTSTSEGKRAIACFERPAQGASCVSLSCSFGTGGNEEIMETGLTQEEVQACEDLITAEAQTQQPPPFCNGDAGNPCP